MMKLVRILSWMNFVVPLALTSLCFADEFEPEFIYPPTQETSKIVIPQNPEALEQQAADTLVYYLAAITGVTPTIVEENGAISGQGHFFVGNTQQGRNILGDLSDLPGDGYALKTVAGNLVLRGPLPIGTLNAVVGLLQDHLNVVWGMPIPLWHSVPQQEKIVLPTIDQREKPRFAYRVLSGLPGRSVMGEAPISFGQTLRASDRSYLPRYRFGHNLDKVIPEAEYAESNPEYFAYNISAGKHYVGTAENPTLAQPCFTNPDVFQLTVDAIRKTFDENPDQQAYSLCTNDNVLYCECEHCAALDAPARQWRGFNDYSGSYFDFMKRVGEELMKSHPDRYITAYAYWGAIMPPRHIERFPDNVHVALTQDVAQHIDPNYEQENIWLLEEWRKRVSTLSVYVYWNLGWLTPRYFPHLAGDYLRMIADEYDVFGVYCEVHPYWVFQAPMAYTTARQMWNPDLDTDELLQQYMDALFGDQSERLAQFYQILEDYWHQPRTGVWFEGFMNLNHERSIANLAMMENAVGLLYQARMAAGDELVAQRLDWMLEWVRLPHLLVQNWHDIEQWTNPKTRPNPLQDDSARAQARIMVQRDREAAYLVRSLFMNHPLHRSSYFSGDRIWVKLRNSAQATQDALAMAVMQSVLETIDTPTTMPDWSALEDWLEETRLGLDHTTPVKSNELAAAVLDAADMLGNCYRAQPKTPVIDGDLSDWADDGFKKLNFTDSEWGRDQLHAWAALNWDDDYLYLAVRVEDEVHIQTHTDSRIWWEDSIQIAIDPFRSTFGENPRSSYGPKDIELGFALLDDKPVGWCYTTETPKPIMDIPMAIVHADGITNYEIALPWELISPTGRVPETFMGVNVAVNGSDGGPRSAWAWTAGIIEAKNPKPFANVWLER